MLSFCYFRSRQHKYIYVLIFINSALKYIIKTTCVGLLGGFIGEIKFNRELSVAHVDISWIWAWIA